MQPPQATIGLPADANIVVDSLGREADGPGGQFTKTQHGMQERPLNFTAFRG
jgi:hypothetical protein